MIENNGTAHLEGLYGVAPVELPKTRNPWGLAKNVAQVLPVLFSS